MPKILEMPKLSPTMEEGVLAIWHKKEGDDVQVDDLLAEVETDKATMEFRAFDKGTLLKLLVEPGAKVLLGQPVAIMGNKGEDISSLEAKAGGSAPREEPAKPATETKLPQAPEAAATDPKEKKTDAADEGARAPAAAGRPEPPEEGSAGNGKVGAGNVLDRTTHEGAPVESVPGSDRVMASPYVRKAARERGIDLHGAVGSGPGGRIVAGDLEGISPAVKAVVHVPDGGRPALATSAKTSASSPLAEPEARPMSMMRKTIARRLVESKRNVPHFYLTVDVDAAALVALREQINLELAPPSATKTDAEERPLKVSINDLLIKAVATALTRVPECNAQYSEGASGSGPSILVHRRVDISVAVAIPDGLVTPVVRNADTKSVVAIAREVRDLAARARAKKLKPEEMQDGTFSISNLGMFGIDSFSAVINPPEGAILAVGQVREEPVVKDGQIAAGKRLSMTLSCDHRVIDGAVGAAFLAELRALVERPMRVLTG